MEGTHLYNGLPGISTKGCGCKGKCTCMEPVTKKIKGSKNGTLLKNK